MSDSQTLRPFLRLTAVAALAVFVSACGTVDRLSNVGKEPEQSAIENPALLHGNRPLEQPMPAPRPEPHKRNANSLWSPGSNAFFKDQRAGDVGDILTVIISINDSANLQNQTQRTRTASESAGLGNFLGLEQNLENLLPDGASAADLVNADSQHSHTGQGGVNRNEQINLRVATTVTQVLPNGNLVIAGRQEVRVNFENRILQVAGIIRPEDITSTNEIQHQDIAEARIAYGGQGQLSDLQQPRYGQQIYDILFPF